MVRDGQKLGSKFGLHLSAGGIHKTFKEKFLRFLQLSALNCKVRWELNQFLKKFIWLDIDNDCYRSQKSDALLLETTLQKNLEVTQI